MVKLTADEMDRLRSCATPVEWNDVVSKLKVEWGDCYPVDWAEKVLFPGGIREEVERRWLDAGVHWADEWKFVGDVTV